MIVMQKEKTLNSEYKEEDFPTLPDEIIPVFQTLEPELSEKEEQCCNAATD